MAALEHTCSCVECGRNDPDLLKYNAFRFLKKFACGGLKFRLMYNEWCDRNEITTKRKNHIAVTTQFKDRA